MNEFGKRFVKDRHKAFTQVLYHDDFKALNRFIKKYGAPKPSSKRIATAGVYKAIQGCTDFSEEEKAIAAEKCIKLGFKPHLTKYKDLSDGKRYAESWLQINLFGRCFCFSRRRICL